MNKIVLSRGCTAFGFDVDNKNISELEDVLQLRLLMDAIQSLIYDGNEPINILEILVEHYGDYESDGVVCESCGDYVESYTLEINKIEEDGN